MTHHRIARFAASGLAAFAITTASVAAFPTNAWAATQCSDGIDNDRDGTTDYGNDRGCTSSADNSEGAGCVTASGVSACIGISPVSEVQRVRVSSEEIVDGALLTVAGYLDLYRFTLPNGGVVNLPCVVLVGTAGANPCDVAGGDFASRVATLVNESVAVTQGPALVNAALCTGELQATVNDIGVASMPAYVLC